MRLRLFRIVRRLKAGSVLTDSNGREIDMLGRLVGDIERRLMAGNGPTD